MDDFNSSVAAEKNPNTRSVIIMRTERTVTIAIPLSLSRVLGLELPPGDWNFGDFVFIAEMESCLFVNSYCREKGLNECFMGYLIAFKKLNLESILFSKME